MVGSKSFSSVARISVIPCLAVQSIVAPFLGFKQNSCWNGRQTEVDSATMVVKTRYPYWLLEYCPSLYRTAATVHFSQQLSAPPHIHTVGWCIVPPIILLNRAQSAHGIPTIAVSLFDGSNSLPTTGTVGRCTVPPILLHLLPPCALGTRYFYCHCLRFF